MAETFTNNGEGRIFMAPADTEVPNTVANAVAALTASESKWVDLGSIHEDGLTVTTRSVDSELKDWNGSVKAQKTSTTWAFKAIDFLSEEAVKAGYGASNVTTDAESGTVNIDYGGDMPEPCVLMAVMKDGDNCVVEYLRNAKCSQLGDVSYKDGEYSANDLTFKSEKPSDGGKDRGRMYSAKKEA